MPAQRDGSSPAQDAGDDQDAGAVPWHPPEETSCDAGTIQCNGACLASVGERASGCTLLDDDLTTVVSLHEQGGKVYYADYKHIRVFDPASETVTGLYTSMGTIWTMAVNDLDVFFVDGSDLNTLSRMPRTGGAPVPLIDSLGRLDDMQIVDGEPWWSSGAVISRLKLPENERVTMYDPPGSIIQFVADSEVAYVHQHLFHALLRYQRSDPATGSDVVESTMAESVSGLGQDDDYLYFMQSHGVVLRAPKDGGAAEELASSGGNFRWLIAVGGGYLYAVEFSVDGHDRIHRMPVSGGPFQWVASLQAAAAWRALVVGGSLYVATKGARLALLRIDLP